VAAQPLNVLRKSRQVADKRCGVRGTASREERARRTIADGEATRVESPRQALRRPPSHQLGFSDLLFGLSDKPGPH
jgi:hypothetical protein